MENKRPFIQYALSKSRTFQSMREKSAELAWLKLEFFLKHFTTADPDQPDDSSWDSIELRIFSGFADKKTENLCQSVIQLANEKFGAGQTINVQQPELYKNPPEKEIIWRLKKEMFKDAVELVIYKGPWTSQQPGPIELTALYTFHLKNPKTNKSLTGQSIDSTLFICLAKNSYCIPTLNFPFEQPDEKFVTYQDSIKPYVPFLLDSKYLRRVTWNKKGTGLISRKF